MVELDETSSDVEPSTVHPEDLVLTAALLSCVIFGKLLELSKFQFIHLRNKIVVFDKMI